MTTKKVSDKILDIKDCKEAISMKIGDKDIRALSVTDKSGRVLITITDDNTVTTEGIILYMEEKLGDVCYIPMDDGSVQAVYKQKDMSLPICAMNSEQFMAAAKEEKASREKKAEKEAKNKSNEEPKQEGEARIIGSTPVDIQKVLSNIPPDALMKMISSMASLAAKGESISEEKSEAEEIKDNNESPKE